MGDKMCVPVKYIMNSNTIFRVFLAPDKIWGEEIGGERKLNKIEATRLLEEGATISEDIAYVQVFKKALIGERWYRVLQETKEYVFVKQGGQVTAIKKKYIKATDTEYVVLS